MSKATTGASALLITLAALAGNAVAGAGSPLQARGPVFLFDDHAIPSSHYRAGLRQFVQESELVVLPRAFGDDRVLVLVRKPTRPLEMHRCGAGFEDYLALIRYRDGNLTLLDKILLQSCEHSIDLDAPDATQPGGIISALHFEGKELRFSVVEPTASGEIASPHEKRFSITKDQFSHR